MQTKTFPLHIAVIGAGGKSGRAFVAACLAAGHHVNAGVHRTNTLLQSPRLHIYSVDATNKGDVKKLLQGCSVVVSLIGHVRNSPADVQTIAINNLIAEMKLQGITRIVSLTGTGVRFPGDRPSLLDAILNHGISIIDPQRIQDGINHARVLQLSEVDWTILRVLKLTNGKPKRHQLNTCGPARLFTSRTTVALALLEIVESKHYVNQAPVVV